MKLPDSDRDEFEHRSALRAAPFEPWMRESRGNLTPERLKPLAEYLRDTIRDDRLALEKSWHEPSNRAQRKLRSQLHRRLSVLVPAQRAIPRGPAVGGRLPGGVPGAP